MRRDLATAVRFDEAFNFGFRMTCAFQDGRAAQCRWGSSLLLIAALVASFGCDPPQSTTTRSSINAAGTGKTENIAKMYELLESADDLPEDRVVPELIFHLSQWAETHPIPDKWQADPLVERLPRALRQFLSAEVLAQTAYDYPDVNHLREALLFRDAARWAARRPTDDALEAWIRSPASGLKGEDADNLVIAARLFDWTVRNVQLDELLTYPKDEAAGPTGKSGDDGAALEMPGPLRAVPGPGYQREPMLTLLGGHGDAIERARVFLLLARQQQLDGAVLAVFDVKTSPRPRPWVPAILIGGQLYLFDTSLGLPLPNSDGAGIATLEAVRKNENYFDIVQADDQLRYPFKAADMGNLVALLEASPMSLTGRMQVLEPALVGEQQLHLTAKPSALGEVIRKIPGINNVGILPACWEGPLYRAALAQAMRSNPDAGANLAAEEALFRQVNPVGQGRRRHLRGQFETEDREQGAKAFYIGARVSEDLLERLPTDVRIQRQLQLERPGGIGDAAWNARVAAAVFFYRQAKMHANFWLGLVHEETDHPEVAVDWLKQRTLEATPPSRWQHGARYNLARCYEKLGRTADAKELYLADDSPQRLGNLLRARRLDAKP